MVGTEQGNFESLKMALSESSFLPFVIIEIRTLDMAFKFQNILNPPPPFSASKLFDPPIYKGKTLFAPPPPFTNPLPINNDHSQKESNIGN
jgi:hypothetical protein